MEATKSPRWISPVDTAKLIRQALKESFPETKFSVRTDKYAGGASIRISYEDGPALDAVEALAARFEGATFDAMIDLKEYKFGDLDGEAVQFGADFVNVDRQLSADALRGIAESIGWIGPKDYEIKESSYGALVSTLDHRVQGAIFSRSKETDLRSQEVAA